MTQLQVGLLFLLYENQILQPSRSSVLLRNLIFHFFYMLFLFAAQRRVASRQVGGKVRTLAAGLAKSISSFCFTIPTNKITIRIIRSFYLIYVLNIFNGLFINNPGFSNFTRFFSRNMPANYF